MKSKYDREKELKTSLNSFLETRLQLPEADYYSKLDIDGFLELKSALSDINNILTLKVGHSFAIWISKKLELSESTKEEIISHIWETKPNTNGFDIEISEPVKLIAEVKSNIPINKGEEYGSAQKNGIAKDIKGLMEGKNKSEVKPNDFLKFMVFLDLPKIREATKHFVNSIKKDKELIVIVEDEKTKLDSTNHVYIVYVDLQRLPV